MSQTPDTPENTAAADNQENLAPPAQESAAPSEAPSLEQQLAEAQTKQAEHYDAWMRAKAETENMRRRAQEDISKAAKFAIEKFANELLVVKDSLEQTLAVENASLETLRDGVDLTLRNLARAFEKSALAEINPLGEKFDPHQHQAISAVESTEAANTVVQVFQKGYSLEGRVLRPALVAVAKAAG